MIKKFCSNDMCEVYGGTKYAVVPKKLIQSEVREGRLGGWYNYVYVEDPENDVYGMIDDKHGNAIKIVKERFAHPEDLCLVEFEDGDDGRKNNRVYQKIDLEGNIWMNGSSIVGQYK